MKKYIFLLIAILPLWLAVPNTALSAGTTYYVSPAGNDANRGTSNSPWKSIQKAANTVASGDTVLVLPGAYPEIVTATTAGVSYIATGQVTVRAFYLKGNSIRMQGFTVTPIDCGSYDGAINISGADIVVENNIVQDGTRRGIVAQKTSIRATIRGNRITRVPYASIYVNSNNTLVEKNEIADFRDHSQSCSGVDDANAIEFGGSGNIFRGNSIHSFSFANQNGHPHADAFQTYSDIPNGFPAAKNTLIERNHIFMGSDRTLADPSTIASSSGFMLEGTASDPSDGLILANNIIEAHTGMNIGSGGNVKNIKIYNNTFRGDLRFSSNSWPKGIGLWQSVTGFEIYNNVTVDYPGTHIEVGGTTSGGKYGYNLMWNSNGSLPKVSGYQLQSADKRGENPSFWANFSDLRLQSNSPAINAGLNLASVTIDFAGTSRTQSGKYDIGAYEFATPGIVMLGAISKSQ